MTKIFFIITAICILFVQEIYAQQNNSVTTKNKIIKIGLLISDTKSVEAKNAAQMAINKANEIDGKNGIHFQLVVKSMEGPWGTGSKQAVDLIFKDNVWAIVGSHDGQNAHLVEQVIAKMHTVFLSTWASDSTLSQAFIPWYFSCVPNDNQQAKTVVNDIYRNNNFAKIATLSVNNYDSKLATVSFVNTLKNVGKTVTLQLIYKNSEKDFSKLFNQLNKKDINDVILFGQPETSTEIIQQMHEKKMKQTIYVSISVMGENKLGTTRQADFEDVKMINSVNSLGSKRIDFNKAYQKNYSKIPSAQAAYAYDGMTIIIEAIKQSGFNREKIQKAMSDIHYQGVSGSIQFDKKGNRMDTVGLIEIKNGIPVTVKK